MIQMYDTYKILQVTPSLNKPRGLDLTRTSVLSEKTTMSSTYCTSGAVIDYER